LRRRGRLLDREGMPPSLAARPSGGETVALVVNPHAHAAASGEWDAARRRLRDRLPGCTELATMGDGGDADRIQRMLHDVQPGVVIAAGGDGTVAMVAHAIMQLDPAHRPVLALVPLGTANDVARAFGLRSCRNGGPSAFDLAVRTVLGGTDRRIDLGQVGDRYFIGSFAVGMDADILQTRNRLRRRLRLGRRLGGYPLYLWSCAQQLLARRTRPRARLQIDDAAEECAAYNILVTNTPLYAGEFRFANGAGADDGRLDLHLFAGPADYVRGYVAAWRRHVQQVRGRPITDPPHLRRARRIEVALDTPSLCQMDGEEAGRAAHYTLRVVPHALSVRVPTDDPR
jgi:diacylglycerol kinase family enzyme